MDDANAHADRASMRRRDFTAFVQKQVNEWAPAVKASGAKLN